MAVLLAHQAVIHPGTAIGADNEVRRFDEARIEISHALVEPVPNTNPASFYTQTSITTEGDEDWVTAVPFVPAKATPVFEVFAATEPAGEKTIAVASTAGFAAGDFVYIRDVVDDDSEWAYIEEIVAGTSIILIDPLTRAHAITTTAFFSNAERISFRMDVKSILRVRMLYSNEGTLAGNTHIKADLNKFST